MVGETWLKAMPFHYCGSIGPLAVNGALQQRIEQIGQVLVEQFGLRGLFGVDLIIDADGPYPVEVNPRYTASMEVLEYATGLRVMDLHGRAFDHWNETPTAFITKDELSKRVVGKAIIFATRSFEFPGNGAWRDLVRSEEASSGSIPPYPPRLGGGRGG